MSVLLVTYDLNKPGQDYTDFLNVIKSYDCTKLSESSYAIKTSKSPSDVYKELRPHQDSNDHVYIIELGHLHKGYGPTATNDWLTQNL